MCFLVSGEKRDGSGADEKEREAVTREEIERFFCRELRTEESRFGVCLVP